LFSRLFEEITLDSPFLSALICFGPFFVILLISALLNRRQELKKVPPIQIAVALIVSLGIGLAGTAISSFLGNVP